MVPPKQLDMIYKFDSIKTLIVLFVELRRFFEKKASVTSLETYANEFLNFFEYRKMFLTYAKFAKKSLARSAPRQPSRRNNGY